MFNRAGGVIGGKDLNFYFAGSRVSAANTSYNFTGITVGDEHDDRMIVVVVGGSSGLQYCRINGVNATPVGTYTVLSNKYPIPVFYRKVPAGATVNVAVNFSVNYQCGIAVYSFNCADSGPVDFGRTSGGVSNLECVSGGVVIAGGDGDDANVPPSLTWNGVDSYGLDVDKQMEGSQYLWAGNVLTTENSTIRDLTGGSVVVNAASFAGP